MSKFSPEEFAVLIDCPHCGADAGEWCWGQEPENEETHVQAHKARVDDAVGYIYDAGRMPAEYDIE